MKLFLSLGVLFLFSSFSAVSYSALITLDFEDGLLPSASGWVLDAVNSNDAVHTVISGAEPKAGGNYVLNSTGRDHYGWVFNLDGLVAPTDSWVFSIDVQRVSSINLGGGGINDIGISRLSSVSGSVAHLGSITDSYWHSLRLEFDQSAGNVSIFLDDDLVSVYLPVDNSNSILLPDGMDNAIHFGFGNINVRKTINVDNLHFESQSAVPLPAGYLLFATSLIVLVSGRRQYHR